MKKLSTFVLMGGLSVFAVSFSVAGCDDDQKMTNAEIGCEKIFDCEEEIVKDLESMGGQTVFDDFFGENEEECVESGKKDEPSDKCLDACMSKSCDDLFDCLQANCKV